MSPVAQGYKSWVSFKEEVAYGTDPGGARDGFARIVTEGLKTDENPFALPGLGGRYVRKLLHGHREVGGDLPVETNFEGGWFYILKHGLGGYAFAVDTPVASANTHTFTPADALPIGLSLEVSKGDIPASDIFLYTGVKVDSFTLAVEAENVMMCTASLICRDEAPGTTRIGAPTFPTDIPTKWHFQGSVTLVGSVVAGLKAFTLQVNNNLERRYNLARLTEEPLPGDDREVTGTATMEYRDNTHLDKYMAETEGAATFVLTSDEIVTGATAYSMSISVTTSHLTAGTPVVTGKGIVELPLEYQCIGSSEVSIAFVNGQTTL